MESRNRFRDCSTFARSLAIEKQNQSRRNGSEKITHSRQRIRALRNGRRSSNSDRGNSSSDGGCGNGSFDNDCRGWTYDCGGCFDRCGRRADGEARTGRGDLGRGEGGHVGGNGLVVNVAFSEFWGDSTFGGSGGDAVDDCWGGGGGSCNGAARWCVSLAIRIFRDAR